MAYTHNETPVGNKNTMKTDKKAEKILIKKSGTIEGMVLKKILYNYCSQKGLYQKQKKERC